MRVKVAINYAGDPGWGIQHKRPVRRYSTHGKVQKGWAEQWRYPATRHIYCFPIGRVMSPWLRKTPFWITLLEVFHKQIKRTSPQQELQPYSFPLCNNFIIPQIKLRLPTKTWKKTGCLLTDGFNPHKSKYSMKTITCPRSPSKHDTLINSENAFHGEHFCSNRLPELGSSLDRSSQTHLDTCLSRQYGWCYSWLSECQKQKNKNEANEMMECCVVGGNNLLLQSHAL